MSKPELYYDPNSPPVRSVLLALAALGINDQVDLKLVRLFQREHLNDDFVKVSYDAAHGNSCQRIKTIWTFKILAQPPSQGTGMERRWPRPDGQPCHPNVPVWRLRAGEWIFAKRPKETCPSQQSIVLQQFRAVPKRVITYGRWQAFRSVTGQVKLIVLKISG